MATTVVLARGSEWGIFANAGVYANWGVCGEGADDDATYKKLGNLVVERFEALCQEHGIVASWLPSCSEVIGDMGQEFEEDLDELRNQATEEIWERWTNGEIEPVY